MNEEKKLTGRGGKREGSGRPKKDDKKKPACYKLSAEEKIAVDALLKKMRGKA